MNQSFLVPAFRFVLSALGCVSLHSRGRAVLVWFCRRRDPDRDVAPYEPRLWNEAYVLAVLALSAANVWILLPGALREGTPWKLVLFGLVLPIYRIAEILKTTASIIFIDRERHFHLEVNPNIGSYFTIVGNLNSWLLMIVIKWCDMILCFSALALRTGSGWDARIASPLDALYATMVTMMTLGYGDFHPIADSTKALVIVEMICFIAYVLLIVPVAAASFKTREVKRT